MKIIILFLFLMFYKIYCLDELLCTTPESKDGYCVTIFNCQKLIPRLIDEIKFKENFCAIYKNEYNYNETELNDIKNKLPWLVNKLNPDDTLNFLKGHYTLNNLGVCCPK